jgi:polyhydroxybutyrate depolymerase
VGPTCFYDQDFPMKALNILLLLLLGLRVTGRAQLAEAHITVEGQNREFVTYLPPPPPAGTTEKLPVIISLHGRLGTATGQMRFADFRPLADREKVIIICPQGIGRSWNDGRGTPAHDQGINDVKFIDQLISYVTSTYNADPARIYITGMSNGGFMCSRLACQLRGRIAAIAVVGASMDIADEYQPSGPMPVMYIQGTKDPLVPYQGGAMKKGAQGSIYSHQDVLKKWAAIDSCSGGPVVTRLSPLVNDGTSVSREEYSSSGRIKVVGYTITGGGHTWPGGSQYLPKMFIGPVSHNLDACQAIWEFFKGNRLAEAD